VAPGDLRVDLKGGLWIRQDAPVERDARPGLLPVVMETAGVAVDVAATAHRWERSAAPAQGFAPVARLMAAGKPKAATVSAMATGQKGWLEPAGMFVDASGAVWLRPDHELADKPRGKNSVQVERTATGYVVHLANTAYRWEKQQMVTAGALPVEKLVK